MLDSARLPVPMPNPEFDIRSAGSPRAPVLLDEESDAVGDEDKYGRSTVCLHRSTQRSRPISLLFSVFCN